MAKKRVTKVKLLHPRHIQPEDLLTFIEHPGFIDDWKHLGLNEDDMFDIQMQIMVVPKKAAVMTGTGGVRKMRFAPRSWNVGKSGAVRVLYVYFERFSYVYLIVAYGKNEMDDLAQDEKNKLAKLVNDQEFELIRWFEE